MTEPIDSETPAPTLREAPQPLPGPRSSAFSSPDRFVLFALLLGFSVDFLFYNKPLGISFSIFVGVCIAVLLGLAFIERAHPALAGFWLLIPILGFSYLVFVRAEPLTTFVNICVAFALGLLWIRTFLSGQLFKFGLLDFAVNYFLSGMETLIRPWPVLAAAGKQTANSKERRQLLLPIMRGLLLAAPILCIFTLLLSSADLIFADRLQDMIDALDLGNTPELISRAFLIGFASFAALGLLVQALHSLDYQLLGADKPHFIPVLGLIESGIILGGINILFAAFVFIQFRYLFGGAANITETGYTYSEYARRGFGELTLVVFISLLVLLALSAVVRRQSRNEVMIFNALNALAVALVGVMVVSALQRLLLYEEIYGFTRLRTYSHLAIIWLGALFVPYLVALLAGRLRWFAPGALFAVIGFTATLNGLNVDRFIAARNIDRATRNGELHTRYLVTLSDDALPELLPLLNSSDAEIVNILGSALSCRYDRLANGYAVYPWQSTHLSHQAAWEALQSVSLSRWPLFTTKDPPALGNFVYIDGKRVTCRELLESYVLEPGLTGEYRE